MPPAQLQELFVPIPAALRHIVQSVVVLTVGEEAGPVTQTLLPTFQVLLLANLGTEARVWSANSLGEPISFLVKGIVVTGPVKTALRYQLRSGGRVLAVAFSLEGFFRLFGVPVEMLAGKFADPDALVSGWGVAQLWEQLASLRSAARLMKALADFLTPHLRAVEAPHAQLLGQLPLLVTSPHLNPIKVMATAGHVSERSLQLRFRKYLGFSAKEAGRFLRFRRVLSELQQQVQTRGKTDWVAMLARHGYHDQSHLIHDFTHFLQLTPSLAANELARSAAICFTRTDLDPAMPGDLRQHTDG